MSRVGIIGLGHIGMNILQTFAQAGVDTVGVETDEPSIARGLERSKSNLSGLVKKGKITPERQEDILSKMKVSQISRISKPHNSSSRRSLKISISRRNSSNR